jgi:preprotein translocase subunit SecA
MSTNFLTKIFGSRNQRLLKQYRKSLEQINALEPSSRS